MHCLLDIEEDPCSRKNILLNYLVVSIQQEVQFCSFGNFIFCYSSVPVVIPYISLKHIHDKFRLYCISECGSSIASLESAIF